MPFCNWIRRKCTLIELSTESKAPISWNTFEKGEIWNYVCQGESLMNDNINWFLVAHLIRLPKRNSSPNWTMIYNFVVVIVWRSFSLTMHLNKTLISSTKVQIDNRHQYLSVVESWNDCEFCVTLFVIILPPVFFFCAIAHSQNVCVWRVCCPNQTRELSIFTENSTIFVRKQVSHKLT